MLAGNAPTFHWTTPHRVSNAATNSSAGRSAVWSDSGCAPELDQLESSSCIRNSNGRRLLNLEELSNEADFTFFHIKIKPTTWLGYTTAEEFVGYVKFFTTHHWAIIARSGAHDLIAESPISEVPSHHNHHTSMHITGCLAAPRLFCGRCCFLLRLLGWSDYIC